MQTYELTLKSEVFRTFRCQKAADSLDIDIEKKSIHHFKVDADIENDFNIGLIVGSSGSGKTTLTKKIFGDDCFKIEINEDLPIIDQLPKNLSYEECANILSGIGLNSVPCWIRPFKTLSNGQKARAEAAILMTKNKNNIVIDEWTSVVDRVVAKAMSHCVQKFARKMNKKIILCSCHYDIIDWVNPDWIIDCNNQTFIDRRSLRQDERERKEKIEFTLRKVDKSTWKNFSKYHYLSEKLPGGKIYCFGLFHLENQIGFQCFAQYVPTRKDTISSKQIYHFNRTVIHPDYSGLGLGIKMINETSSILKNEYGYKIMGKFSSIPVYKAMIKNNKWVMKYIKRDLMKSKLGGGCKSNNRNKGGFRTKVKTYSFEFVG